MYRVGLCHMDIGPMEQGGISTLYKHLALELQLLGHEVHVVTAREGWHPPGIRVHQVELPLADGACNAPVVTTDVTLDPKLTCLYADRVARTLEPLDLDIVECSTWGYELLSYTRRSARRSKVLVRGDLSAVTLGARFHGPSEKELLCRADARVFVSAFAQSDIERQYGIGAGEIIHLGVDDTFFSGRQPPVVFGGYELRPMPSETVRVPLATNGFELPVGKTLVVWVGKPTIMKGFDHLLQIIRSAPDEFFFVVCLGHSVQHFDLELRANSVYLQDLPREQYMALLQSANVFLTTSRWEGFGLAVLEAMASGQPIVFPAECSAVQEFVRNGRDGLMYAHTSEAQQALRAAGGNFPMRRSARVRAREFTWSKVAKLSSRAYDRLIECL